jgi:very-short-patch-repair endonuclease
VQHDATAGRIAARQHGLLTLRQACLVGFSDDAIRHRVDTGRWRRVHRSVFALTGVPPSREQVILAALLAAGDGAVASHRTAAELWFLPIAPVDVVHLTVPTDRRVRLADVVVHRSRTLAEESCIVVGSIPLTNAARTIFDLSSSVDSATLGRVLDDALRRHITTLRELQELVDRSPEIAPGRSPSRIREVLATRLPGYDPGDSDLETKVWEAIARAGLPLPRRRYPVRIEGDTFVLDMAYPEQRIAIEVDGYEFHRERGVFDRDRTRQNALVLAGWPVLRFTSRTTEAAIVEWVRRALFGHSPGP